MNNKNQKKKIKNWKYFLRQNHVLRKHRFLIVRFYRTFCVADHINYFVCHSCFIKSAQIDFSSHKHAQLIFISTQNMSLIQNIVVSTFAVLISFPWTVPVLGQRNNVPSSPCPSVFQYKYDDNGWFGVLEVPSPPIEHREVILHVSLSLRASTSVSNSDGYGQDRHNLPTGKFNIQ